jgi:CheY-like chemotaxis protein
MGAGSHKILVVDDDMLILLALSRAYRNRQLDVATAASACHAVTLMEKTRFDLFIIDLDLHGHSGYELLALIDRRFPYVPVIITTAVDINPAKLTEEITSIRKKGVWHLLEKPFRLDLLNSLIEKNLDRQENLLIRNLTCSHEHGENKRQHFRKPHILPTKLSFEVICEGEVIRQTVNAILTDISDGGVGLLTDLPLEESLVVRFENPLGDKSGVVTWSAPMADRTCRAGVNFC